MKFKALIKFLLIGLVIILYFLVSFPLTLFIKKFPYKIKKCLNYLISAVSKIILLILDLKVAVQNIPEDIKFKNYFIVSNHLGYLDILALSSVIPTSYVTSMEIRKTPFLGSITELAGCLYVDRKNKKNIHAEIIDIEMALIFNLSVTVFPEATSTNGENIRPFKRSLYQASVNSGRDTLPLTINYKMIGGEKLAFHNRDRIFWYGDMRFLAHLWNLCSVSKIEVDLIFSDPISPHGEFKDSTRLRDKSYEDVNSHFIRVV